MDKLSTVFHLSFANSIEKNANIAASAKQLFQLMKTVPKSGLRKGVKDIAKWTFKDVSKKSLGQAAKNIAKAPFVGAYRGAKAVVKGTGKVIGAPFKIPKFLSEAKIKAVGRLHGFNKAQVVDLLKTQRDRSISRALKGKGAMGKYMAKSRLRLGGFDKGNISRIDEIMKSQDVRKLKGLIRKNKVPDFMRMAV